MTVELKKFLRRKSMNYLRLLTFTTFLLAAAPSLYSQSGEGSMLSLTLEDLKRVYVQTPSGKLETVSHSPGIISVMTEQEIRQSGARNVAEILDKMPGISLYSTYFSILTSIGVRGDIPTNTNNHTLFLIDGRPFRETIQGGTFNRTFLTSFPVAMIRRIELLRGPGSVLYGNSAFTGIINIITMSNAEQKTSLSAEFGSFGSFSGSASTLFETNDVKVKTAATASVSDGWIYSATDGDARFVSGRVPVRQAGGYIGAEYKDFKAMVFAAAFSQRQMEITSFGWPDPPFFTYSEKRMMADIGYAPQLSKSVLLRANFTSNLAAGEPYYDVDSARDIHSSSVSGTYAFESTAILTPAEYLTITAGAAFELRLGEISYHIYSYDSTYPILPFNVFRGVNSRPLSIVPRYNENALNGHILATYVLSDEFSGSAGVQYFRTKTTDDAVFRLAGVYSGTSGIGAKLLFASGYRAPSSTETNVWIPGVLTGNDNLRQEYITTLEGQISYSSDKLFLVATLLRSRQTNIITLTLPGEPISTTVEGKQTVPGAPFYINRGNATTLGIELEGKAKISSPLSLQSSFAAYAIDQTFRTATGDTSTSNYTGMPTVFFKAGLSYNMPGIMDISVFDVLYAGTEDIAAASAPNGRVRDFNDVNINVRLILTSLFKDMFIRDCSLNLKVKNLLDRPIFYPEYSERTVNSVPGRPGRELSAQVSVTF